MYIVYVCQIPVIEILGETILIIFTLQEYNDEDDEEEEDEGNDERDAVTRKESRRSVSL